MPIAVTTPSGFPPIAAMSLRLTATMDQPMSYGPIPFGMCVLVTIMSVVTRRYLPPMSMAAQSSPMPMETSLLTSLSIIRMVARSPSVPRVFMHCAHSYNVIKIFQTAYGTRLADHDTP